MLGREKERVVRAPRNDVSLDEVHSVNSAVRARIVISIIIPDRSATGTSCPIPLLTPVFRKNERTC